MLLSDGDSNNWEHDFVARFTPALTLPAFC